jgi:hypothetical protein
MQQSHVEYAVCAECDHLTGIAYRDVLQMEHGPKLLSVVGAAVCSAVS